MENLKTRSSENVNNETNTNKSIKNINEQLARGIVYDDLPQKQRSEIRIFLSSTFKDFKLERNHLIEHVYEPLRNFCNEKYQKEFILIDMRWGITDETTNQNLVEEVCLNEIDKCRNESVGPYFVCFLSHRYKSKFLKSTILENEFEHIRKDPNCIISYKSVTSLLEYCYELDENNIKRKSYKLKNADDIMKGLKINDKNEWEGLTDILANRLRQAADNLYKTGTIGAPERDQYFQSVTEQEVRHGLLNENNPNRKCAALFRDILVRFQTMIDIKTKTVANTNIKYFTVEDQNGESQMNKLKKSVAEKLSNQNKRSFQIEWEKANEFKEPFTKEIKEYLRGFGEAFRTIVTTLITINMNDIGNGNIEYDSEILHHALLCSKLNKQSIRRDDLTQKVKLYLDDESNTRPFIVFGASGSGKSTILARTIKHCKGDNNVFIYRFMGTSRESSNMKSIMLSILRQLKNIYEDCDEGILDTIYLETISIIKETFIKMLQNISTKSKYQKLVIVLDSIDQLSKDDYSLEWFIYDLPKNIKMIYSVILDYSGILNKIRLDLEFNRSNYLKIDELENSDARLMLENWLRKIDRKLNGTLKEKNVPTQWSFVNELLSKTPQIYPLHIRIIFDIVSKWPSWYKVENEFKNCTSTKDTIKYLFKRLENFHGQILFSRCVFYLTLFEYSGISEAELEDILSIDDELLNSVFVHHHPPVRRFQIALWLKIKYDLKDYITNKETDGVSVISWFHRSFIEASQECYENMFKVGEDKDKLLMNVVDYFTEKYNEIRSNGSNGVKKEFEYKKKKIHNFDKINDHLYAAYRCTKSQKIKLIKTSTNNNAASYNKRKLNELLKLISMMQDNLNKVELLKEHVYFNYEFMHAKCELKELNFIFEMDPTIKKLTINFTNDQKISELNEINQIYKYVYPKIRQDPNLLNIEVLSRLSDKKSCFVEQFQKPSGLKMISSRFIEKEPVKDLFIIDSLSRISKFYEQFKDNLLFIESTKYEKKIATRIDVIDSTTSKSLGSIPFDKEACHIQIVLNNQNTNDLNKLTELNGFIYFANGNSLFKYSFTYHSFDLICSFKTEIEGLLLLNSTHLLINLRDCLFLFNLQAVTDQDKLLIEPTFRENNEIKLIESTIPKEIVFNSQYLDSVDSISIIARFKDSNLIKIYKFSSKNEHKLLLLCTIDSIKWSFYGKWKESTLIDESFMIDNMTSTKLIRVVIKFALQYEGVTKIIEVDDKGEFNVVNEINENILGINDKEKYVFMDDDGRTSKAEVSLKAFKNDRVIFTLMSSYSLCCVYFYNIEKKCIISKTEIKSWGVYVYFRYGLIVSQCDGELIQYKINDDGTINQLLSISGCSGIKIKIKNGKLLKIETEKRLSIKEIDYLNESKESKNNGLIKVYRDYRCNTKMYEIDGKHILIKAEGEKEEKVESYFSIVQISGQKIVKSDSLEADYDDIIGCKNGYLVLFNDKKKYLIVYKIENKQESFKFNQIFKEQVNGVRNRYFRNFHFNDLKPNRFIITLYDKTNDKIEVRVMEEYDENKLNVYSSTVSLNNIQLKHDEMSCLVTSLNEYLFLYASGIFIKRIYLIDITGDKIIDCIKMYLDFTVKSILNSNDLIARCGSSLNYIKYDVNSKQLNQIKLKSYEKISYMRIEIQHEYLFVMLENYSIEIHKLDDKFKNNNELRDPIKLVKKLKYDKYIHISTNKKYLVIYTGYNELYFYKLDDFKQIASLYLNDEIGSYLVSNEDYISFRLRNNSNLITFKIIENMS